MSAKIPGNLGTPAVQPKAKVQNQPTFWQVLSSRFVAALFLLNVWIGLATGRGSLPVRHSPIFLRDQDPTMYWFCIAFGVVSAFYIFFYAPYHRWNFTFKFPPPPPDLPSEADSYAGYKRPPQVIVHPKLPPLRLSDFYEPAFLRSILLLACVFGLMVTAVGAYQLVIGEVYFPDHGALDVASLQEEPQQFFQAMIPYGLIGLLTLGLGIFLQFWRPVRQAAAD